MYLCDGHLLPIPKIMATTQLEKELLQHTKGLPKDLLREVIDFIQFLRQKKMVEPTDDIAANRNEVSASQTTHLEEEFKNYKKIYPHE
jgi:hypothetical protein